MASVYLQSVDQRLDQSEVCHNDGDSCVKGEDNDGKNEGSQKEGHH